MSCRFLYQPSPAAQTRLGVPVERIRHRKRGGTIDTGPRGRSERPLPPTLRIHYKSRCRNIQTPMKEGLYFLWLWALSRTTCAPELVRILLGREMVRVHWVRVDNWVWPVNKGVEWRPSVSALNAQTMSRGVRVSLLGDQLGRIRTYGLSPTCWAQWKRIQSLYSNIILHIYNIIYASRPWEYIRRFSISCSGNHALGSQV